ncbi:uncharacterized protein BCR38DRAFT_412156 [Pseudomassariella vexata]|uniref:Uncharacterized protein n=1 Tax=Pseudomassariella vexata TaxID=1141098 RepID=A0A1Y2DL97_9PEZI|nr:uncharacterized protein BCR38DRAFT_412156 [Pseudomassariella vexata]ORY59939.1 hypothetical protein BCR38DRAFT_412156 [Pseudomassariella vexata]
MDYYVIPSYPHTKKEGIATFVHCGEPLLPDNPTDNNIRVAFTKIKDQIEFDYAGRGSTTKFTSTSLKFIEFVYVSPHIHDLQKEPPSLSSSSVHQLLKVETENRYNSFLKDWNNLGYAPWKPLRSIMGACSGQQMKVFERHGGPKDKCTWVGRINQDRRFCGMGDHNHHPPLPDRISADVARHVRNQIRSFGPDVITLTTRMFLLSGVLSSIRDVFGVDTLRQIEDGLNIEDRVEALIRKERLMIFPAGSHFAGACRQFELEKNKPRSQRWIRHIHRFDDYKHFLIICCTQKQAELWKYEKFLQVDLSYKMIKGDTNLFSFAGENKDIGRIITYIYCFTNWDSREAYAVIFQEIFRIVADITGEPIKGHHLNGGIGIQAVTLDMCPKQAPGLGDYLRTIDPSRTWEEHLRHILIFCYVHVQRNFWSRYPNHPWYNHLYKLWETKTRTGYVELVERISRQYPELRKWFKGKQVDWVVAGLVPSEGLVNRISRTYAFKHSNLAEFTHFEENNASPPIYSG